MHIFSGSFISISEKCDILFANKEERRLSMKRVLMFVLILCLLAGCSAKEQLAEMPPQKPTAAETVPAETMPLVTAEASEITYSDRFDSVTEIVLSDAGIFVDGAGETEVVFTSRDIIYYEDKESYESGNPYGEGEAWERHTQEEANAHTVVNITAPGAYRVRGKLSKGQIRVDLGENAYEDENAIVELILSDADISCQVAPAVLFLNVYECDGAWSTDTAKADVDTSAAGANLILEGSNTVNGSHVAKIFKDKEGEKKLWKQDGAIYSYMSMNVFGPGNLDLTADNEGMDTELHLTINGGEIAIRADNDGINTNEDGVSVTTINGGNIHIIAGLGAEGDGIDSNGSLVINGGTVVSSANPGADAGIDSDLGSYIHGGTVIALGSTMDWAESDSEQVTMNLQFASNQSSDAAVVVTREDGTVIFAYDPGADEVLAENTRVYSGAVLSGPNFRGGETYHVYVDGEVSGSDVGGMYDVATITGYTGGTQMAYTGTDVMMRPGGMGFGGMNFGGDMPEDFDPDNMPEGMGGFAPGQKPEDMEDFNRGQKPEGMENFNPGQMGGNFDPGQFQNGQMPEGMEPPKGMENFDPSQFQNGEMPDGFTMQQGGMNFGSFSADADGEANTLFYMQDKVNFFSGLTKA